MWIHRKVKATNVKPPQSDYDNVILERWCYFDILLLLFQLDILASKK